MSNIDPVWALTFVAQAGTGLALVFFSTTPGDSELGRLLLASAFGQTVSAGSRAGRRSGDRR